MVRQAHHERLKLMALTLTLPRGERGLKNLIQQYWVPNHPGKPLKRIRAGLMPAPCLSQIGNSRLTVGLVVAVVLA